MLEGGGEEGCFSACWVLFPQPGSTTPCLNTGALFQSSLPWFLESDLYKKVHFYSKAKFIFLCPLYSLQSMRPKNRDYGLFISASPKPSKVMSTYRKQLINAELRGKANV